VGGNKTGLGGGPAHDGEKISGRTGVASTWDGGLCIAKPGGAKLEKKTRSGIRRGQGTAVSAAKFGLRGGESYRRRRFAHGRRGNGTIEFFVMGAWRSPGPKKGGRNVFSGSSGIETEQIGNKFRKQRPYKNGGGRKAQGKKKNRSAYGAPLGGIPLLNNFRGKKTEKGRKTLALIFCI